MGCSNKTQNIINGLGILLCFGASTLVDEDLLDCKGGWTGDLNLNSTSHHFDIVGAEDVHITQRFCEDSRRAKSNASKALLIQLCKKFDFKTLWRNEPRFVGHGILKMIVINCPKLFAQ